MNSQRVYVLAWARTPFGRFGGVLADVRLPVLGAVPVKECLRRAALDGGDVDEVVFGVNFPGSERSVARQVALRSGLPDECNALTVDRACCSSMTAVTVASRGLRIGDTGIAIAGGVDSLSRVPYFIEDMRFGSRRGNVQLEDQLVISCPHTGAARAIQASMEAKEFGVDRRAQDDWALRSQARYERARVAGLLDSEVTPVDVLDRSGNQVSLHADEVPRPDSTLDDLSALPTVNGSETVTAGNAPNMSTGASALLLSKDQVLTAVGATVTLEAWTQVSGDPARIASIPARAVAECLSHAGLDVDSVDVIEINEAFAAVPLVSSLVLAEGDSSRASRLQEKVNVNGGAIAVGHPTGASAGRLIMAAAGELIRRGGGVGVTAICGGIGEAEALLVRVS